MELSVSLTVGICGLASQRRLASSTTPEQRLQPTAHIHSGASGDFCPVGCGDAGVDYPCLMPLSCLHSMNSGCAVPIVQKRKLRLREKALEAQGIRGRMGMYLSP